MRAVRLPRIGVRGTVAVLTLAAWAVAGLLAPWIAPHSAGEIVSDTSFAGLGQDGLLGTDTLGRDVLSRVLFGATTTLWMACLAAVVAFVAGAAAGFAAAVFGGGTDMALSRVVDALLSFPSLLMALVIVSAVGVSEPILILTVGFIEATRVFRIARAVALQVAATDFVDASRMRGETRLWIMSSDIWPNAVGPLATDFGIRFTYGLLLISGLGFLGLGVPPPTAEWGTMVRENMAGLALGATGVFAPALAILTVTLAINVLVDLTVERSARNIPGELKPRP